MAAACAARATAPATVPGRRRQRTRRIRTRRSPCRSIARAATSSRAAILDPGASRRHGARHILRARDRARCASRRGTARAARTSHATEPTSPIRRGSRLERHLGRAVQVRSLPWHSAHRNTRRRLDCDRADCHGTEVALGRQRRRPRSQPSGQSPAHRRDRRIGALRRCHSTPEHVAAGADLRARAGGRACRRGSSRCTSRDRRAAARASETWQLAQAAWPAAAWSAGSVGGRVAGRARGRRRDAAGPVRAMASLAAPGDGRVRPARLVLVAVAHAGVGWPACGSWQPWHSAGGPRARLRLCLAWQVPQARAAAGACATDAPWHEAQSWWPGFEATSVVSRAWQVAQRVFASSAANACGLWHASQAMPPAWAPVSNAATFAWQLVHASATTRGSSPWGAWHVDARRLAAVRDLDVRVAPDARRRGLGRSVRRVAARADRVRRHRRARRASSSRRGSRCTPARPGDEVVRADGSRCTSRGPPAAAPRAAHGRRARRERGGRRRVIAVAVGAARRAGVLGVLGRALVVAARAVGGDDRRRLVHAVALGAVGRGVLHDGRAGRPRGLAWQPMHVGAGAPGANAWHDRQLVAAALRRRGARPRPPSRGSFAQTAVPGFLNPSRSKSWQAWHSIRLAHVGLVAGARAKLGPRRGDDSGRHSVRAARPAQDERRDRRPRGPRPRATRLQSEAPLAGVTGRPRGTRGTAGRGARPCGSRSPGRAGCRPGRRRGGIRRRAARPRPRGNRRTTSGSMRACDAVVPAARRQPAGRVRAARRRARADVLARVAVDARALGVARRAEARVGARLLGVARGEAGAVQAGRLTSSKASFAGSAGTVPSPWHDAHCRSVWQLAQRSRALAARVPCSRIQSPSCTRWSSGRRALGGEVDVASIAVAQRPLVAVLVAAEAGRHLRQDGVGPRLGHLDVAAHAVALRPRACDSRARSEGALRASSTASRTYGLAVARPARALRRAASGGSARQIGVGRKVQRPRVAGGIERRRGIRRS